MSNRNNLVDGLHSILECLWDGSDQAAASEFRELMVWRARAVSHLFQRIKLVRSQGRFQDAQDLSFLESAADGMRNIEMAFVAG
jgi:hypothetical protein